MIDVYIIFFKIESRVFSTNNMIIFHIIIFNIIISRFFNNIIKIFKHICYNSFKSNFKCRINSFIIYKFFHLSF